MPGCLTLRFPKGGIPHSSLPGISDVRSSSILFRVLLSCSARQQQPPCLSVLLTLISLRMPRLLRQNRHRLLLLPAQQHRRRNQIPHIPRNYIRRKKVDLLQRVRLAVRVRLELAQVSILRPAIRRLHLHPQDPRPRFNPNIVSRRITPRLRHFEPLPHRPRHKLQLYPLTPFLESPEPLALSHLRPSCGTDTPVRRL